LESVPSEIDFSHVKKSANRFSVMMTALFIVWDDEVMDD